MPKGRVHLAFELTTLPLWSLGGAVAGVPWEELVIFTLSYVGTSLFLSPDLDLPHSDVTRRWLFLRYLWYPYSRIFRHRGLSHSLLFGPLTRLLYLGAWAALCWAVAHLSFGVRWGWPPPTLPQVGAFLGGIYWANFLHVFLDRVVSSWVRLRG